MIKPTHNFFKSKLFNEIFFLNLHFFISLGRSETAGSYGSNRKISDGQLPNKKMIPKTQWNRSPPPIRTDKIRVENLYSDTDERHPM